MYMLTLRKNLRSFEGGLKENKKESFCPPVILQKQNIQLIHKLAFFIHKLAK